MCKAEYLFIAGALAIRHLANLIKTREQPWWKLRRTLKLPDGRSRGSKYLISSKTRSDLLGKKTFYQTFILGIHAKEYGYERYLQPRYRAYQHLALGKLGLMFQKAEHARSNERKMGKSLHTHSPQRNERQPLRAVMRSRSFGDSVRWMQIRRLSIHLRHCFQACCGEHWQDMCCRCRHPRRKTKVGCFPL